MTGNFKASYVCRILDKFYRRANPTWITSILRGGVLLYWEHGDESYNHTSIQGEEFINNFRNFYLIKNNSASVS